MRAGYADSDSAESRRLVAPSKNGESPTNDPGGLSENDISKILGENTLRVMRYVESAAKPNA